MDETLEKRSTRRFANAGRVEIRVHGRKGWCAPGELVDCSEAGVGLQVSERLKRGTVVLLRVSGGLPPASCHEDLEGVAFNMVTAKVRWCREVPSPAGVSFFRVGVQRMLPFY